MPRLKVRVIHDLLTQQYPMQKSLAIQKYYVHETKTGD